MPRVEEMATSLMQLATTAEERTRNRQFGEDILEQATAGQHWVAIGDIAEQEMTNAGRKIKDGILFRAVVSVAGRRASHCWIVEPPNHILRQKQLLCVKLSAVQR